MSDTAPSEKQASLSEALVEKAEKELGEKPQWRQRDIEALRHLVKKDQSMLLTFLDWLMCYKTNEP